MRQRLRSQLLDARGCETTHFRSIRTGQCRDGACEFTPDRRQPDPLRRRHADLVTKRTHLAVVFDGNHGHAGQSCQQHAMQTHGDARVALRQ